MLRLWLAGILALSVGHFLRAQVPQQSDDLYALALKAAADEEAKSYGNQKDFDAYNLIVEKTSTTTDIPGQLGPFHVAILDDNGLRERFRKHGEFRIKEVFPARIKGSRVTVNILEYWYRYREAALFRRAMTFRATEGGAEVEFRFDCDKRQFVVDHVRLWGI
jgi:hypothetical protein